MQLPSFVKDLTVPPLEWHNAMRSWFRTMRNTEPVWFDEENACWRLFLHEHITYLQHDYQTFSSEAPEGQIGISSIIGMDPPRHRELRSLLTQAFSARAIAQLAPHIQEIANELIQHTLPSQSMDAVADLAIPLPIFVIIDMLGLPREQWRLVKELTDVLMVQMSDTDEVQDQPSDALAAQQKLSEFAVLFLQVVAEHRQHPRQDIMSLLLAAEADGKHLSDAELYGFFLTLLVAGNLTTTQLLGNALLCFDEHPAAWAQLRQDPSLVPSAVEEILRYMPPNRGTAGSRASIGGRIATTAVKIGDRLIEKESVVYPTTLSANFDERQFSEPERFDIQRNPNRHLSFGHGIHFCLGAPLARLEVKIALEQLLKLVPEWHRVREEPLVTLGTHIVFGVNKLPIVFQPS